MDFDIREQIATYVAGGMDAASLEDQIQDLAWDLDTEPSRSHAATALRLLAERANGDWTDPALRDRLGALNRVYWFDRATESWGSSDASFTRVEVRPWEVAGRLHVAAYV